MSTPSEELTYLFVCKQNINRSYGAKNYFTKLLEELEEPGEVISAGTDVNPDMPTATHVDSVWRKADKIFVMDDYVMMRLHELVQDVFFPDSEKEVIHLDVPDCYDIQGKFLELPFSAHLQRVEIIHGELAAKRVAARREFDLSDPFTLDQVLDARNLAQYIGRGPKVRY